MTNDNIINVSSELSTIRNYIADIDHCTLKVKEVKESALMYQTNCKINIMTIAATIYSLLCAIFGFNWVLIGLGIILACIILMLSKKDSSNRYMISCIFNCFIIVFSILFCMIVLTFVPIFMVLVEWTYMVICSIQLKKQIEHISSSL